MSIVTPGVPDLIERTLALEIAHFEPETIVVTGVGVYPNVLLSLQRLKDDDYHRYCERAKRSLMDRVDSRARRAGSLSMLDFMNATDGARGHAGGIGIGGSSLAMSQPRRGSQSLPKRLQSSVGLHAQLQKASIIAPTPSARETSSSTRTHFTSSSFSMRVVLKPRQSSHPFKERTRSTGPCSGRLSVRGERMYTRATQQPCCANDRVARAAPFGS